MILIPIISISINEQLREFINKLVSRNQYENRSKLIRDALLRLMSTMDAPNIDSLSEISPITKKILGNMIIVAPHDFHIQKKINKIELNYKESIVSKNQHFQGEDAITFVLFEGSVQEFQDIVVEINSIKEIKNFRYLIVN